MSKKSTTFAAHFDNRSDISRSRAVVARQAHNLKVGGSIPPSATREAAIQRLFCFSYFSDKQAAITYRKRCTSTVQRFSYSNNKMRLANQPTRCIIHIAIRHYEVQGLVN